MWRSEGKVHTHYFLCVKARRLAFGKFFSAKSRFSRLDLAICAAFRTSSLTGRAAAAAAFFGPPFLRDFDPR
jgi:hypothetical protein